jgi:acyl dehydratase
VPLDYHRLMAMPTLDVRHEISERDTILYALGIGARELGYVYEDGLEAFPTIAAVVTYPGFFAKDPKYGLTWQKVLHAEQSVEIHRPFPSSGAFHASTKIDEIFDKGADKGAIMEVSRVIYEDGSPEPVATVRSRSFLRGDGGFGNMGQGRPPAPHAIPDDRAPDISVRLPTHEDQALIYRLSGDYNPLHIDPEVARSAGFDRPILHGLCTYGVVGRALVQSVCEGRAARLKRMDVRFSSPVYPGEAVTTEVWHEGEGRAAFRARIESRDVTVINNGLLEYQ